MSFKYIDRMPPFVPEVGFDVAGSTSALVANQAYLVPVWLPRWQAFSTFRFAYSGAAVGTIDFGIYRPDLSRLFSLGSTAYPAQPPQVSSLPFPGGQIGLSPGLWYLAIAASSVGTTFFACIAATLATAAIRQKAASFPLPASMIGSSEGAPNVAAFCIA